MAIDFNYWLGQKYAGQGALRDAQANLTNTQAQNYAADQQGRIKAAQTSADASMLDAQSQAPLRAAMADNTRALTNPTIAHLNSQTGLTNQQTATSAFDMRNNAMEAPNDLAHEAAKRIFPTHRILNDLAPGYQAPNAAAPAAALPAGWVAPSAGASSVMDDPAALAAAQARRALLLGPGYAKGTSKVPGAGTGKVDTVPAMLAPGEAVLNKGAAEHFGRDNIKHLNTIGQYKMGMVGKNGAQKAAGGSKGKPGAKAPAKGKAPVAGHGRPGAQHFAGGTENVQPGGGFVHDVLGTAIRQIFGNEQPVVPVPQAPVPVVPVDTGPQYRSVLDAGNGSYPAQPMPQPVRYATGHSNVGKGKKSDTPQPSVENVRKAFNKLHMGMAKKPLPKGFGNPGMV